MEESQLVNLKGKIGKREKTATGRRSEGKERTRGLRCLAVDGPHAIELMVVSNGSDVVDAVLCTGTSQS